MLEFRPVLLSDKKWADELLRLSDFRGCEYTFGNNFCWQNIYDIRICRYKDFYLLKNKNGFFFPAGKGDIAEVIAEIGHYCKNEGISFNFTTMNKLSMLELKEMYGGRAEVYSYEDLTELKGKKYHAKRNHIARFSESNWSYEEINSINLSECMEMNEEWCRRNNCMGNADKAEEICAVRVGLENYEALGYTGGLIRVNGTVQAFTFGEQTNSDTFVVHVEKAFTDFQGAYPMINKQFLANSVHGAKYVNREEDMGEENLRKAKLSYYPCFMEEKFRVRIS